MKAANFRMPYGKYGRPTPGLTLAEIYAIDRGYIHWLSWRKDIGLYCGKTVSQWAKQFLKEIDCVQAIEP